MQMWMVWKGVITFGSGFTSGFTLKDALSFVLLRHRARREWRLDDAVVAYLLREFESAHPTTDAYGQASTPYYRGTSQIADAVKEKTVDMLQRLERMEIGKRVKRAAPRSDQWTLTQHELHDHRPQTP